MRLRQSYRRLLQIIRHNGRSEDFQLCVSGLFCCHVLGPGVFEGAGSSTGGGVGAGSGESGSFFCLHDASASTMKPKRIIFFIALQFKLLLCYTNFL